MSPAAFLGSRDTHFAAKTPQRYSFLCDSIRAVRPRSLCGPIRYLDAHFENAPARPRRRFAAHKRKFLNTSTRPRSRFVTFVAHKHTLISRQKSLRGPGAASRPIHTHTFFTSEAAARPREEIPRFAFFSHYGYFTFVCMRGIHRVSFSGRQIKAH